ncbi:hypothetical protein RB2083_2569 [Rhodobacteraceae bacterium HTCC2083]|nr:hypothetical protein RB2083_2569 [Rhodobacteraceae bacterium HTCC2083]
MQPPALVSPNGIAWSASPLILETGHLEGAGSRQRHTAARVQARVA